MTFSRDLVIGLDCSTTACKAIAWDRRGRAQAAGRAPLPMQRPRPSWHEQPAESWWGAAVLALRSVTDQVDPRRLAAICIAPQRETFVITDAEGNPLMSSLLWMDERCRDLLPDIERQYGKQRIHQETGKPLSANLTLGKLFWLKQHRPELFYGFTRVLDVHAYLAYRLTGRFTTAWGCADPTGLFDMRLNQWNESLIQAAGFEVEQFPEALPGGEIAGKVLAGPAQASGLPEGLPLVAGLGDGQAAGLGVNVTQPGPAYLNLGTAVVSGTCSDQFLVDPAFRTMYGGAPGIYSLETVILGGTYTINWFVDQFGDSPPAESASPVEWLEAAAEKVTPGASGLMLVPYWNSAMNPFWDASASGIIAGWRGIHKKPHVYRAILEGIAFEQRLHTSGVEATLGQIIHSYIAVGGGARSNLWRQIIADVTGKPVYRAEATEASALGAGILAAAAAGWRPDLVTTAEAMTSISPEPVRPETKRQAFYDRLYQDVYQHLYPALQVYLARLADLSAHKPL